MEIDDLKQQIETAKIELTKANRRCRLIESKIQRLKKELQKRCPHINGIRTLDWGGDYINGVKTISCEACGAYHITAEFRISEADRVYRANGG